MAKKVTKKSKKVVKKASKKKAAVKKAGKKKVSSADYRIPKREIILPKGGTRELAVNELGPSLEEELRQYAAEASCHQVERTTPEAPKPSLFQRIKNFLGLGN